MKPKKHKVRTATPGGDSLKVMDINDINSEFDNYFEDDQLSFLENETTNKIQETRIEALKRAIDIAKLMSGVTPDDIINIAVKVITYLTKE